MERIKLFKGDDTDFNESEFLIIRLDTNASLEGFKASFRLGSFVQDCLIPFREAYIAGDKLNHIVSKFPDEVHRSEGCG